MARQVEATDRLRSKLNLVGRETAQLHQRVSSLVGTVGLTRYDAFPDVGGQLSYSAFLDEAGDGVVLTAINGRAETRSYAKPVRGGAQPQPVGRGARRHHPCHGRHLTEFGVAGPVA